MAEPMSTEMIDKMRTLFLDGMSINGIAKKLGVSGITVTKYRDREKWADRKQTIKAKVERKLDNDAVERRYRKARLGKMMQLGGQQAFVDANGKLKKNYIRKPSDAIKSIIEGVRLEEEAAGDGTGELLIKVKLPKELEGME